MSSPPRSPPSKDTDVEPSQGNLRSLARLAWLAPAILGILFCVGQLALWMPDRIQAADTRSKLKADYSLWPFPGLPTAESGHSRGNPGTKQWNAGLKSSSPATYWPTSSQPSPPVQPYPYPGSIADVYCNLGFHPQQSLHDLVDPQATPLALLRRRLPRRGGRHCSTSSQPPPVNTLSPTRNAHRPPALPAD